MVGLGTELIRVFPGGVRAFIVCFSVSSKKTFGTIKAVTRRNDRRWALKLGTHNRGDFTVVKRHRLGVVAIAGLVGRNSGWSELLGPLLV